MQYFMLQQDGILAHGDLKVVQSGSKHSYERLMLGQVALADGGSQVELVNPNGLQLLTRSHQHRAPDKRFGEPEELLKDRCVLKPWLTLSFVPYPSSR